MEFPEVPGVEASGCGDGVPWAAALSMPAGERGAF
jgi:hypothetical protein